MSILPSSRSGRSTLVVVSLVVAVYVVAGGITYAGTQGALASLLVPLGVLILAVLIVWVTSLTAGWVMDGSEPPSEGAWVGAEAEAATHGLAKTRHVRIIDPDSLPSERKDGDLYAIIPGSTSAVKPNGPKPPPRRSTP